MALKNGAHVGIAKLHLPEVLNFMEVFGGRRAADLACTRFG